MSDDDERKKIAGSGYYAREMRNLGQHDREQAIAASPNVVGYERFMQKHKQVCLRSAYRKPQKPGPGGQT